MTLRSWDETLINAKVDGGVVSGTTSATSIIAPAAIATLPPNWFYPGRTLKLFLMGRCTVAITPSQYRFDVRLGGTVVFDTLADVRMKGAGATNAPFRLEIELTCRDIGAAADLFGESRFQSENMLASPANTAGGNGSYLTPVGAPALGATFDSTVAQTLDVFLTPSSSTSSLTVHQYRAESQSFGAFIPGRRALGLPRAVTFSPAKNYTITGIARDASGNFVAGAQVVLYSARDLSYQGQVIADAVGAYSFVVPDNGDYFVAAFTTTLGGATPANVTGV